MTGNIPEEIISKIMLYNSHKTADIIKSCNPLKFERFIKTTKCSQCHEIIDWVYIHNFCVCVKCRINGIENHVSNSWCSCRYCC